MKKSKLFRTSSAPVPKLRMHNKNHEVIFTQPFGRVMPIFWSDIAPGERYQIHDNSKIFSQPFAGMQLSNITSKTRFFAVPLRKAVPRYEEFKTSDPNDNLTELHTTIYNLLRGACMLPSSGALIPQYARQRFYENLQPDGLSKYIGVPWLLDQLCCIIFGRDLAYMEEFAAAFQAAGGTLDRNGNWTDFRTYFFNSIFGAPVNPADNPAPEYYHLAWYSVAIAGEAPNYSYAPANLAYYPADTLPFRCIYFPALQSLGFDDGTNLINYILEQSSDHSLTSYIRDKVGTLYELQPGMYDPYYGGNPLILLSNPNRDTDNSETFFGTPVRLAPFCAYQKLRYDWFTDLRMNDNVHEKWIEYISDEDNYNSYVTWRDSFLYESEISSTNVRIYTLSWLLTAFVIDYEKDYFTTAAFEPQAGQSPVIGPSRLNLLFDVGEGVTNTKLYPTTGPVTSGDTGKLHLSVNGTTNVNLGEVWAQVNESDEITPLKLRWQMAFEALLERRNISGYNRYTDLVLGQYGIRIPDQFLQRSVYLGGFKTFINTNLVVAKADGQNEQASSILGEFGSYGYGYSRGPRMAGRFRNEHAIIIGVNYVVPQNYYTQGLPTRLTDIHVLDHPHWQFRNVGEQPILNREIFLGADPKSTFGYQKRYSDKKFMFDEIHGDFLYSLRYMHTGRKFYSQPSLNQNLLSLRGQDGHNDVLAVLPRQALPFWCEHYITFKHWMTV